MTLPGQFWLLLDKSGILVWSRKILAFAPVSSLAKHASSKVMDNFWFMAEEEVVAQATELPVVRLCDGPTRQGRLNVA